MQYHDIDLMLQHWKCNFMTFLQAQYWCCSSSSAMSQHRHNFTIMSRHWGNCWNRCRNIVVDVMTMRRSFLHSSRKKKLLFFPILFLQFQFMLMNISLSLLKILNSNINSNTQIFNSINLACIHGIVEIFTQLFNKGTVKLLCNF